jgi:hypothetical protein
MQELLSNKVFVFVCYQAGSGGENLSYQISKFDGCAPLECYRTKEDRTVITNEFFDKIFLRYYWPREKIVSGARQILEHKPIDHELIVVPSHWDYPSLSPYFPNSKYVRIVHNGDSEVSDNVTKKVYGGKFETFLEFIGFCSGYVEENVIKHLLKHKEISMEMNAGQVFDVLKPYMKTITKPSTVGRYTEVIDNEAVLNVCYKKFDQSIERIYNFIKQGVNS